MSIYQQFCQETFDEKGALQNLSLVYPQNFNFAYDVVDAIAKETPDKRALVWCNAEGEERIFSFQELSRMSNQAANIFSLAGLKKGDHVMVMLKRHYEYWVVTLALHKLGVVVIPATHMLMPEDILYRLTAANVRGVVCTSQDEVPAKFLEAMQHFGGDCILWTVQRDVPGFRNLTTEMPRASSKLERTETDVTDPMVLYFTSGTTGLPKGVVHNFAYPLAHIVTARYWQAAEEDGLHFTIAETGWAKASWGKLYGQWLAGSAVMVYDFDTFDPKALTTVINQYGVTSFCAPPTVYRYLVRKGVPDMPGLRHATTAGEKLAPEVFKRFRERTGLTLREGYGQTETTLLIANMINEEAVEGSMGKGSPYFHIQLLRKDGTQVDVGELGEICVVPPENEFQQGIFTNYLGNEEQYARVWRGGVYHTGDAAWQDENGYYWFHGRFDDIIKTGGFRVGPYEIEHVLVEHPHVAECSVVGVEDALRGQAIKAFVKLNPDVTPSGELERALKDFTNSQMAEYKWIRHIEFVEELPKTISGKVRKVELRAREQ